MFGKTKNGRIFASLLKKGSLKPPKSWRDG